ncbi:11011_t:CDS:2, partial [Entrophospora sp. SA101]
DSRENQAQVKRIAGEKTEEYQVSLKAERIDTHVSGPVFKADPNKPFIALDGYSTKIQLYNDVPKIFQLIKGCSDTKLAVASRTEEPE